MHKDCDTVDIRACMNPSVIADCTSLKEMDIFPDNRYGKIIIEFLPEDCYTLDFFANLKRILKLEGAALVINFEFIKRSILSNFDINSFAYKNLENLACKAKFYKEHEENTKIQREHVPTFAFSGIEWVKYNKLMDVQYEFAEKNITNDDIQKFLTNFGFNFGDKKFLFPMRY